MPKQKMKPIKKKDLIKQIDELISSLSKERSVNELYKDEPLEAFINLSGDEVSVFMHSSHWEGVHKLVEMPVIIASLDWKMLPASVTIETLDNLFKAAVEIRRNRYRVCKVCGKNTASEWRDGNECYSCMGKSGVDF